jgi:hypothetical protein
MASQDFNLDVFQTIIKRSQRKVSKPPMSDSFREACVNAGVNLLTAALAKTADQDVDISTMEVADRLSLGLRHFGSKYVIPWLSRDDAAGEDSAAAAAAADSAAAADGRPRRVFPPRMYFFEFAHSMVKIHHAKDGVPTVTPMPIDVCILLAIEYTQRTITSMKSLRREPVATHRDEDDPTIEIMGDHFLVCPTSKDGDLLPPTDLMHGIGEQFPVEGRSSYAAMPHTCVLVCTQFDRTEMKTKLFLQYNDGSLTCFKAMQNTAFQVHRNCLPRNRDTRRQFDAAVSAFRAELSKKSRDRRERQGYAPRDQRDRRDQRDPRDRRDQRDQRDRRDQRDQRDRQDRRDPRDQRDQRRQRYQPRADDKDSGSDDVQVPAAAAAAAEHEHDEPDEPDEFTTDEPLRTGGMLPPVPPC